VSERDEERPASEWDWILAPGIKVGGCLMFAKGVSAERVIEAFGMDPDAALLLSASRAGEALPLPVTEVASTTHPWVRAGQAGEWAFAIDQSALDIVGYHDRIARGLSSGTELAMFIWTQTIDGFHYLVDGTQVTFFEPLFPSQRFGTEPDRFLAEMRQSGMPVDSDTDDEYIARNPSIVLLEMLTLALGIRLPADVALGPLLTVQRTDPVTPSQVNEAKFPAGK
jgi:hypothetical protein